MYRKIKLSQLARLADVCFTGKDKVINGLNLCDRKSSLTSVLSYVAKEKYIKKLCKNSAVTAVVLPKLLYDQNKERLPKGLSYIFADQSETVFYTLHHALCNSTDFYDEYNFKNQIGENVQIAPTAVVEDGVIIGNNVVIGSGTCIHAGTRIGDNVVIGANSSLGGDGFQLIYTENHTPYLIKHTGGLKISDFVSIGSNTVIDKSLFEGFTFIGSHAQIGSNSLISHNCEIGDNAVVTFGGAICGSVTIGKGAWIAPNASVLNKVTVGEDAFVGIGSVVLRSVKAGTRVFGVPADEI